MDAKLNPILSVILRIREALRGGQPDSNHELSIAIEAGGLVSVMGRRHAGPAVCETMRYASHHFDLDHVRNATGHLPDHTLLASIDQSLRGIGLDAIGAPPVEPDGNQQSLAWLDAEAAKLIPSGCAVLRRCTDEDGDLHFAAINFHRDEWIDWEREAALGTSFAVLDYRQIQPNSKRNHAKTN